MQLFAFLQSLRACTCLEEGREGVVIGGDARAKNIRKEHNRSKRRIGAGVATGQGVEDDNVRLGNLVEQVACVVHGRATGIECTQTDELGEDSEVILEVGFDGKGLDLLELSERGELGYERERRA